MKNFLLNPRLNSAGQTMVEYALLLLLLVLVVAGVIPGVATVVSTSYTTIASAFP